LDAVDDPWAWPSAGVWVAVVAFEPVEEGEASD
jgi:hypothetical protein